jgi:hypothetical protein
MATGFVSQLQEHLDFETGAEDLEMYSARQEAELGLVREAWIDYLDNCDDAGVTPLSFDAWKKG